MRQNMRGFTLMEIMIAVAIVGILASIALPSYQENLRRSRRAAGTTAIYSMASQMERYYATNNYTYVGATFTADVPSSSSPDYSLALSNLTATTYTITATRKGIQANDACGSFTLTQAGVRGQVASTFTKGLSECWR